ncbi:MAG: Bcr/CflA family multidrug efflux MFS transporter [Moraxellaceae bacterium]|jgi:DHA1 family bicyclomycin/chloramphenicol resistance-like MFS transporter|nr:Bcr/CflA family multidrug efflux MFS transporter [Moraxellaceae bacterium]HQV41090.1 Bcr/CflA family multidrug efflux MFS transporter [Moraxellaceae bacterium]
MFKQRLMPGWIILMGALTAIGPLSIDMYLPGFPAIGKEFDAGSRVELSLASFFIGLAIGQLFYGPISDRYGRKPPLYFGLSLFLLASVGAATSQSIEALIGWRFIQGLGGCAGMVIARAVVRDRCDAQEAARAFSLLILVMGIAPILAPLLGGIIVTESGWRSIFIVLAIFAFGCLVAIRYMLKESHSVSGSHPLILRKVLRDYLQILTNREFMRYTLSSSLAFTGMFAYIAGSPHVLMQVHHIPPQHYGWIFGSNALGLIAASQLNARLLRHYDLNWLLNRGVATAALSGSGLALFALFDWLSLPALLAGLFIFITSLGFISPNASAAALAHQGHRAGTASALMGAIQFALATLAGACMSIWHDGSAMPLAIFMGVCGVGAWGLLRTKASRTS